MLKEKPTNLKFYILQNYHSKVKEIKRIKNKSQTGRKYFQKTYLIKHLYPQYAKKS